MKRISIVLSVFLLGFVLSSCAFPDALSESETKTASKPSTSESSKAKTEEEKPTTVTASVPVRTFILLAS